MKGERRWSVRLGMKNAFSAELNCQEDVEKISGLSICLWVIESLPAVCWVFYSSWLSSCIHLEQRQTPGNLLPFNMQQTGWFGRKSHIVILWIILRSATGRHDNRKFNSCAAPALQENVATRSISLGSQNTQRSLIALRDWENPIKTVHQIIIPSHLETRLHLIQLQLFRDSRTVEPNFWNLIKL